MPNGNPTKPEDLVIDAAGKPLRIDRAYSWESPLAAHGLMHMVITNAANHDPYPIDTLLLFMANMAWNSSMNTTGTREMLSRKDARRRVRDPVRRRRRRVPLGDRGISPTSCCPDTTYLERHDAISLLDRPISEPDAAADAIRHPVVRARPRRAPVAGRAGRARVAAGAAGVHQGRRLAQVRRLPGLHRQLREAARHRLSRRMARRGRRVAAARQAESAAVGEIHRARVVLRLSLARIDALLQVREQGLPGVRGEACAVRHAAGGGHDADLLGAAAEVPPGRAGPVRRAAAAVAGRPRARRDVFRSAAVLVPAARKPAHRAARTFRSTRSRSGR